MYVATKGFGDAASTAQKFQTGASLIAPAIPAVLGAQAASAAAASGSAAAILGIPAAVAVPIIGAVIVGAVTAITMFIKNSGCGITCVETSQWANQAEPLLKQNADAYFATPAPRTQSQQQAALNAFDTVWARLQQLCGQPGTGNAGVRCISDRQAGSCKWHATGTPPWPGSPAVGACWNWFAAYRDPIANDPNVVPDAVAAAAGSSAGSSAGAAPNFLLPALVGAGLLWWVLS